MGPVEQAVAPVDPDPLRRQAWAERRSEILVLSIGLGLMLVILLFQDWLARRPTLLGRLRTGYLLFTLFFVGWHDGGHPGVPPGAARGRHSRVPSQQAQQDRSGRVQGRQERAKLRIRRS